MSAGFIYDQTEPERIQARVWNGWIASGAVDSLDRVDVVIPKLDPNLRWTDIRWQPRDNMILPKRGDDCAVIVDNNGEMWVVAWWPDTRSPWITTSPATSGPPVAAVHGDVWIATASTTGYVWQFIYDANWTTDAYKWKFLGGSEAYAQITTQQTRPGSSGVGDLATVGPSLPIYRAGVFHVRWGSLVNTGNSSSGGYCGSVVSNAAGTRLSVYEADSGTTQGAWLSAMTEEEMIINPAVTIKMQYFNTGNQTATFGNRWLSILPLRIS